MKTHALLALPLALGLSACISFGAKPPPSLLTLQHSAVIPTDQVQNSATSPTITIGVPQVPQELATARVPVRSNGTTIAYVKDAVWVEPPSRLFARLLADTLTVRTGRVVLSNRQSQADPGAQLTGELRMFGVDAGTNEAIVIFDATLNRGDAGVFEKRRFEARVPVTAIEAGPVGVGLNQAANKVAEQVSDWVGK